MKRFIMLASLIALSPSAFAQKVYVLQGVFVGCQHKEVFNKQSQVFVSGDKEAWKKYMTAALYLNECVLFKKGQQAYLSDTAILSGMVKIRLKGDLTEYWTNLEAIK